MNDYRTHKIQKKIKFVRALDILKWYIGTVQAILTTLNFLYKLTDPAIREPPSGDGRPHAGHIHELPAPWQADGHEVGVPYWPGQRKQRDVVVVGLRLESGVDLDAMDSVLFTLGEVHVTG